MVMIGGDSVLVTGIVVVVVAVVVVAVVVFAVVVVLAVVDLVAGEVVGGLLVKNDVAVVLEIALVVALGAVIFIELIS